MTLTHHETLPAYVTPLEVATSRLDTALLIARVQAKAAVREARTEWQHVGRFAMTLRLAAALSPLFPRTDDAMALCRWVLSDKFLLDLTEREAAEVCAAILAGHAQRLRLTASR